MLRLTLVVVLAVILIAMILLGSCTQGDPCILKAILTEESILGNFTDSVRLANGYLIVVEGDTAYAEHIGAVINTHTSGLAWPIIENVQGLTFYRANLTGLVEFFLKDDLGNQQVFTVTGGVGEVIILSYSNNQVWKRTMDLSISRILKFFP